MPPGAGGVCGRDEGARQSVCGSGCFGNVGSVNKQSITNVKNILKVLSNYQLKSTLYIVPLFDLQQKVMQTKVIQKKVIQTKILRKKSTPIQSTPKKSKLPQKNSVSHLFSGILQFDFKNSLNESCSLFRRMIPKQKTEKKFRITNNDFYCQKYLVDKFMVY